MSSFTLYRVGVVALLVAGMFTAGTTLGQEKGEAQPAAKAEKKEKAAGRLPPYYGQVVSKEQRAKIYQVQARFADQIQDLRDQITELEKAQMDEMVAVLSLEQRAQIAKLVEEAKSKRSKKTATEGEPAADPAK